MIVQRFNLNLIPNQSPVVVHVNQYDTGTGRLIATLYEGNEPYSPNGTAVIQGTKPDGHGFQYTATLDGNVVTADLTEQMAPVAGDVRTQIVVTESSGVTGTFVFIMRVQPSALPSDADMSESDYPLIEEAIREAQEAVIDSHDNAENSEAWAQGTRGGVPVGPTDPTYEHNAEYWAHQAETAAGGAGHTILNGLGQEMPQRKNLRFAGANLSDDAHNDTTNVTITGGSGGSTITVTTIETTLYGETVTITDGTSTFMGVFDDSGVCVIDGVTATGTLTVSSGGASRTLNVPYFGNYTVALSFWAATINVSTDPDVVSAIVKKDGVQIGTVNFTSGSGTYIAGSTGVYTFTATVGGIDFTSPTVNVTEQTTYSTTIDIFSATLNITTTSSALFGKTITIKKGSTVVGTTAFSARGSASYTVHETGTYTCECEGYSGSATVSAETTYNVTINAGLDLSAWITAGSTTEYPLNPSSYADFSALEADEAAVRQLMTAHASVDYLATATAGDSLMQSVINSDVCAKWINLRDYALDTLSANSDIKDEMNTADKYGYGEWGIVDSTTTPPTWGALGCVPIMTANNAPYGVASAYQVFDGNASTTASGTDFSYQSVNPICAKKFECSVNGGTLQGSNDGSTYTDISDPSSNTTYYMYHRVHFASSQTVNTLQFYGRELKPLVPTMTSNTTPRGKAIADEPNAVNMQAYKAFDNDSSTKWTGGYTTNTTYIGYLFDKEQKVQFIAGKMGSSTTASCTKTFKFQYMNGSSWSDISNGSRTVTTSSDTSVVFTPVICNVNTTGIRAFLTSTTTPARMQSHDLQFYGSDYSEKEFATGSTRKTIYDHGVAPSGAITGGTKNPDCLTLSAVGTATIAIDKGTRTYMGGKAGLHASGTNRLKCGSGYSAFTASNMPDSNGFDISSISGSVAIGIEQTASGTFDAVEIWIE